MATIEMAGEAQPLFHDFLGMSPPGGREAKSYGAQTEINGEASVKSSSALNGCTEGSVCSAPARFSSPLCSADPGCSSRESERLSLHKSRTLQTHGNKSAFHRLDIDSGPVEKKRVSPQLNGGDHRLHMVDAAENTRSPKMLKFEAKEDRGARQHDAEDLHLAMQPPRPASSCPTLLQPSVSKPDVMGTKRWESGSIYGPSRLGKSGGFDEKISCAATTDNVTVPSFSRPAADEGSRTGLQGSGIANLVNNGTWASVCENTGATPGLLATRSNLWSQGAASDPSIPTRRQIGPPASSQLTIFYGGQAHVFDDVSPEKADAIIGLAGSNGRSWSTTYSAQARSTLQSSPSPPFAGLNST